ncbi:MAG: sulfatase [bacterium]
MILGNRRARRIACALLAVVLSAGVGCSGGRSARSKHPNVVIYLIDALRKDHLGVYGYPRSTSPYIDAFAREAVIFEDAYSTTAWTKPAVASLLTGLNPPRHGVLDRRNYLPDSVPILSEYLKALGYATNAVITNPHASAQWGFGRGFDRFSEKKDKWDIRADEVNDTVFKYLSQQKQPFFYYIHTIEPHGPIAPTAPYDRMFGGHTADGTIPKLEPGAEGELIQNAKCLYDGAICFNDLQFGRLLAKLRTMGLYDDTLIILVADHGEEHMDHGMGGHGEQLYNEVAQIPLIVKYPRGHYAGTRTPVRASLLDIVPTVLAVAGADAPGGLEGLDLSRFLESGGTASSDRALFLDLNQRRRDGTLRVESGVVDGSFKYMEDLLPEKRKMLYDLDRDPAERTNLIATDSSQAARLAGLLEDYQRKAAEQAIPQNLREPLKALGYIN